MSTIPRLRCVKYSAAFRRQYIEPFAVRYVMDLLVTRNSQYSDCANHWTPRNTRVKYIPVSETSKADTLIY